MSHIPRRAVLRALGAGAVLTAGSSAVSGRDEGTSAKSRPISERLGSTHVDPDYSFSSRNVLNEGAERLQGLGTDVIKVWFHQCDQKYPQNSEWPSEFESMVERAEHPHFRELFDRPFKTFILSAYRELPGDYGNHYFRDGLTDTAYQKEVDAFYDVTKHFLETYDGTGKEFLLQHWQGDWAIIGSYDRSEEPTQTAIDGMIRWLNARQEGVTKAREEVESDVTVLHAAEVNIVLPAMWDDERRVINEVIPETNVDLVSHNSYDEMFRGFVPPNPNAKPAESTHAPPAQVRLMQEVLDYVNGQTPSPSPYVQDALHESEKNVFLGEYGFPESTKGTKSQTVQSRRMTAVALDWGAPWVVYWQLYDNNDAGWWLIREDGTKTPTYAYFEELTQSNTEPTLPEYVRLDLDWSHQKDEHAFACSTIELRGRDGGVVHRFDVGSPLNEPIFWEGCYWATDGSQGRTLRWFGGDEQRTTIFVRRDVFHDTASLRLRGYPKVGGIEATLRIDGTMTGRVELSERQWDWWNVPASTTTPTATSSSTPSETPDATEPPTRTAEKRRTATDTKATSTTGEGMGVVSALTGVGLAYRHFRNR